MENEIQYYLDDDGGLWKKVGHDDYFFSRKELNWIKSEIVFISLAWDYDNKITADAAEKIQKDYKAEGKLEDEKIPFRYFSNDNDFVFAEDIYGNEFYVLADMTLKPADKGTIDLYWGGVSKEEAETLTKQLYMNETWIMVAKGERLECYIGDYKGIIWLGEYQDGLPKSEKGYRSEIVMDDGMSYPCTVAYFEGETVEELKQITEQEMKRRTGKNSID